MDPSLSLDMIYSCTRCRHDANEILLHRFAIFAVHDQLSSLITSSTFFFLSYFTAPIYYGISLSHTHSFLSPSASLFILKTANDLLAPDSTTKCQLTPPTATEYLYL